MRQERKRFRDWSLRPAFWAYTLVAFGLATLVCALCVTGLENLRMHSYARDYWDGYREYEIPAGGSYEMWADEDGVHYRILNAEGVEVALAEGDGVTARVTLGYMGEPAGDEESAAVTAEQEAIREIIEKLPYSHLSLEGWDGNATKERFDDPRWKELSDACLACGTCTFSCPTCQCYDIKDFNTGHGVQRYRCWDSCMYSDFTLMAHGNNRTTQLQRFRQRFMHKLVYYPANNDGMYSCVGCGRCVEKCPQGLNIVKVIKRMGGSK